MKAITEFMKMLRGLHGSSAASIVYRSELKHNKTLRGSVDKGITWSSVFGDKEVIKRQVFNTNIGVNYESCVNRQLVREGVVGEDFVADRLPYGRWEIPDVVIEHNGDYQLRGYAEMGIASRGNKAEYFFSDGSSVTDSDWEKLKGFLPVERDESSAQDNQGVEKTVKPRNFKLSNIESVKMFGKIYT